MNRNSEYEEMKERLSEETAESVVKWGLFNLFMYVVVSIGTFIVFMFNLPSGLLIGIGWMIMAIFASFIVGYIVVKILSIFQRYILLSEEERIVLREIGNR